MKLPHYINDEHSEHLLILALCAVNLFLLVILFFSLFPTSRLLPKITPISTQTPIVDFNIISPRPNSTVSGKVPLVTTLTNGPKILKAELTVDGQKIQTQTTQKTSRLTIFWDSTKVSDGAHSIEIKVVQDNRKSSMVTTSLIVQNNVSRNISQK